jgi:3D (Asp-Asp-Asp) domain-containing protein
MTNVVFTAYCACTICCGPNAVGLTASGKPPIEGITVAAARSIPLGTRIAITIPSVMTNRSFVVQDRLAKRFDNRVDIFFNNHQTAKQFGKQVGSYELQRKSY